MRQMKDAKQEYDEIPIPAELSERVTEEIQRAERRRKTEMKRRKKIRRMGMGFAAAAAAVVVVFTAALNTSTAFAKSMGELPVIGAVARVLTFHSYESETEDLKISVEVPSVDMISEDLDGLEQSVNEEIHNLCQQYADEAIIRAEEYRQAFLDTGGTEEEWAAHNIEIKVWYEVKSQTEDYLSLAVMGTENWTTAYSETRYYNFDLKEGKLVTLEDLLGADYAQIADESILSQIPVREEETGMDFWDEDFAGVDENTKFYINEAGHPVVVFDSYEIAPGAAGQQEFEIVK